MPTPLSKLGENAVLERLLSHLSPHAPLITGPGDDCAVIPGDEEWDILLKTDVVVENIHFTPDTAPERIGHKAIARAISDIAAMGGLPEYALITLLMHPSRSLESAEGIYRGISRTAARFGISVAGGETSSLPTDGLVINVALTGRIERGQAILRSGGNPGDIICVSGPLGGSFPSGHHLDFEPRLNLSRFFMQEGPRPTAMMDLSDGLGTDLPRLARASDCGFQLNLDKLPLNPACSPQQGLTDGEDYELLFTISPENLARLTGSCPYSIYPIGALTDSATTTPVEGWQHFRS